MGMHAEIRSYLVNRAEIEDEIERLIAMLDAYDGDCDLEPESDLSIEDEPHDGETWAQPVYAVDQRRGPVNVRTANREYLHAMWSR